MIAQALHADGYTTVTAADVEEIHRDVLAGRAPNGIIGKAIAGQMRLLEENTG